MTVVLAVVLAVALIIVLAVPVVSLGMTASMMGIGNGVLIASNTSK